jgi:hypothetical protein
VYWTEELAAADAAPPTGGVFKGAPDGGRIPLATSQLVPRGVLSDATQVYWEVANPGASAVGSIRATAKSGADGGTDASFRTLENAEPNLAVLVRQDNVLYWTAQGTAGPAGYVKSLNVTTSIDSQLVTNVALPRSLAVDGQNVYFTTKTEGVFKVPKTGGTRTAIAVPNAPTGAIAVDDKAVYFTLQDVGQVMRVAK